MADAVDYREIIDYGVFVRRLADVQPGWTDIRDLGDGDWLQRPVDTGSRWELLRQFQQEWGFEAFGEPRWPRDRKDEHKAYVRGLFADEPAAVEATPSNDLELPIPRALDEWWDLPFNSFVYQPKLYWTIPVWPPELIPSPKGYYDAGPLPPDHPIGTGTGDPRLCVAMTEYEECNVWVYAAGHAGHDDPPVLVDVLEYDDAEDAIDRQVWVPQSRSVSEFFLHLAAVRIPSSLGWTVDWSGEDSEKEIAVRLGTELPNMGFLPWRELGAETRLYGAPDAIVYDNAGDGDSTLWACGRTRAALEQLGSRLGVDWNDYIRDPHSGS